MTQLCDIGFKYGTDKCPQIRHTYTPFYYELFKDKRNKVKKVFEMGIGCPENMSKFNNEYKTGASLYMWREFFPHAKIYGADILPQAQIKASRIKTFICDELNKDDLKAVIKKVGSDIDLFIDDALHDVASQVFLCKNMMPLLQRKVIYVIEDVFTASTVMAQLKEYKCEAPKLKPIRRWYRNNLVVVRK